MTSNENRDPAGTLVVFGGASGIGLATATLGIAQYQHVVIVDVDRNAADLDIVRSERAALRHCDAVDPAGVQAVLADVLARCGSLTSVVTTVGGAHVGDALDLDLVAWRKEIAFNLDSAYVVSVSAARLMVENGGGSIVTSSSSYGFLPGEDRMGYCAGKAGVIALTKSLARATGRRGVRVNCVAPGSTDTPRMRGMAGSEEAMQARYAASPQGRITTTEDQAEAILFLSSPAARSMTGQVLWVNNGMLMP
ncbi:3-oxoacyl-ACP reductase FabG [soil metagenome]